MLTSREIRQQFLDFFVARHAHTFVPSSPVVPHGDPTLLFANAGMNQFKDVFLGTGTRPYTRAVNTQKCIRAGGKHNDLEDVGKDTYHHTFFEMLGNWSFGDYFKKEAIAWAWQLLVDQWGLDPTRLHATYFGGDPRNGLAPDEEARELWLNHLPPDHVHPGNMKDNFWEMGDTGPCGPCSEIHIDRTPGKTGAKLVNAGVPEVMEIWNLVFMQFNRGADGHLSPLPARHVDTGMGFERICSVIQKRSSNYDTDVFTPVFAAIQQVTGARPYGGRLEDAVDIAYRVIADHIRTLTFALTDGAVVSNEGRGYVLRRILRRAVRHGRQTLGVKDPFFCQLVPAVVDAMGDAFPELKKQPQAVADQIREEEESFGRTIDRGIELFEAAAARSLEVRKSKVKNPVISADDAFKLYDTYGFPLDLTQVMAEERGMAVDVAGFEKRMEQQREQSRASSGGGVDVQIHLTEIVQKNSLAATEFLGYETTHWHGKTSCHIFDLGDQVAVVTGQTPFYAEQGGQVGDQGTITAPGIPGAKLYVRDTQKVGDVFFHLGQLEGKLPDGPEVTLTFTVDAARRGKIMANHTMTHVLNHKLRAILGEHIMQKGSLVDDQKTRFDFAHNSAVQDEELAKVEELVNTDIQADLPVSIQHAPQEQALKIHGLRAVFGEKYPPTVRVLAIGVGVDQLLADPRNAKWQDYSVEFCGGTHLARTAPAKALAILSEEAVGKGVRRITAVTGEAALAARKLADDLAARIEKLSQAGAEDLAAQVAELAQAINSAAIPTVRRGALRAALAELQKKVKDLQKQQSQAAAGAAIEVARDIADKADGSLIVAEIPGADADALRSAMDVIRKKRPQAALLLAGSAGPGKVAFVAAVPPELVKKGLKAGDWVREVAKVAGGGGGGRPDMAQAGGKDATQLPAALDTARQFATAKL